MWMRMKLIEINRKTSVYQFWTLLCRCHPCEARQNKRKRRYKVTNALLMYHPFLQKGDCNKRRRIKHR